MRYFIILLATILPVGGAVHAEEWHFTAGADPLTPNSIPAANAWTRWMLAAVLGAAGALGLRRNYGPNNRIQ
ncbi:MAG: hypothetical protein ACLFTT_00290 [Candidatus Hydrogenedentota bacterium]